MQKEISHKFILDTLIENVPHAIFWKDTDFIFRGCNREFARQFGFEKSSDIIGKKDSDFSFTSQMRKKYRHDDENVLKSIAILNYEEEQRQPDGKIKTLLVSKTPLFSKNKKIIGILGIYADITKLKEQEKELIKANRLAQISNKSKSEFIANVSHDIRTPLAGMTGVVQDLLNITKETKKELARKDANTVKKISSLTKKLTDCIEDHSHLLMNATHQLLQLCNEILEVTRLENGISSKPPEVFDLHALAKNNIELLTPVALNKKIRLTADIDKGLPRYFIGLKDYTNRIFLNVLSNALKFTKKGYVKLKILHLKNNSKKHKNNVAVQIMVEDTGIGIPEDKFDVIFENFSRLTPSYQGLYKGSGLGLYTVKRYVESMNGHIEVESRVGEGACFKITLPFVVSDKVPKPNKSTKFLPEAVITDSNKISSRAFIHKKSKPGKETAHVLLVEDSPIVAMALNIALKPLNCFVDVARNGQEAVDKATKNRYDLILMDVGLPDFSGVEATKKIRSLRDKEKANIPIIAVTGHATDPERAKECLDAGMQETLPKSVSTVELEAIFQRYVPSKAKPGSEEETHTSNHYGIDKTIFDMEASVKLLGSEKAAWHMLDTVCQDMPLDVKEIKDAQKRGDVKKLKELLHKIRGGLHFFKVPQVEAVVIELNESVKTKPLLEIKALFTQFYLATETLFKTYRVMKRKNKQSLATTPR